MAVARTFAVALTGVRGDVVEVEADISAGLPAFVLIGLPDAALGESRKRVSAAASNAGCALTQRKLTVNLSPASLRKQGSGFDLAIAVAAMAASGEIPAEAAAGSWGSMAGCARSPVSCRRSSRRATPGSGEYWCRAPTPRRRSSWVA